jgi:Lon protease-like protein
MSQRSGADRQEPTAAMSSTLPLFPLNTVLFPGMPLPLRVFEERYLRMLRLYRDSDPVFGVVLIRTGQDTGSVPEVHATGTAASLAGDGHRRSEPTNIVVTGGSRFRIVDIDWSRGFAVASIAWLDEPAPSSDVVRLQQRTKDFLRRYVEGVSRLTGRRFDHVRLPIDPVACSWEIAARLPLHTWERQALLEEPDAVRRFEALRYVLRRELALLYGAGAAGLAINHPGGSVTLN